MGLLYNKYIIKEFIMAVNISRKDVQDYAGFLKRRMMMSRILGIFTCLLGIACIVLFYLKIVNDWMCLVVLAYCMANCFSLNSNLQGVKVGNPWQRVNSICAIILYLFVVFLISYGFASGEMSLQF